MQPEFRRVHQGGHHDVWCDGVTHRKTEGGFCHPDVALADKRHIREFPCDCADWKEINAR
jgi:hypothetical protein